MPSRPPLACPAGARPLLELSWILSPQQSQTVIKSGFQNLESIQKSLPEENWPQ